MKNWIKNLLSSSDETSSKRFIALTSLLVLIGMIIANGFGIKFDDNLTWIFASLAGGTSVLTTIEKFIKPKTNE